MLTLNLMPWIAQALLFNQFEPECDPDGEASEVGPKPLVIGICY